MNFLTMGLGQSEPPYELLTHVCRSMQTVSHSLTHFSELQTRYEVQRYPGEKVAQLKRSCISSSPQTQQQREIVVNEVVCI